MSLRLRSSSVGSRPKPRLHRASRAESAAALALDVRCACQFYETKSLLPERVNPIGYDTTQEFGPCVHIQTRPNGPEKIQRMLEAETGLQVKIVKTPPINPNDQIFIPPITNHINLPTEFSPAALNENAKTDHNNVTSPMLANRSVSCNNMGVMHMVPQPSTPFMRQRDPSTSSLLRKRMSEERQGFSTMEKCISQSTANRDRFIPQKDLTQSTILRRKLYNRSTASFGNMTTDWHSTERAPSPNTIQPIRMSNERTFYHDTNDAVRNSNINIVEGSRTLDRAAPLSMKSHGNRRFVPSSIENLPIKMNENVQPVERHENLNRNSVKTQIPIESMIERNIMKNDLHNQNVSDEEKVQILLSRSQTITAAARSFLEKKQSEIEISQIVDLKPVPVPSQMQLMNAKDVEDIEVAVQAKPQVQYVAKMENTLHPMEAQTNDYSYSKLFDNYQSDHVSLATATNISTPDLNKGYIRQRDPSHSLFTRHRYRALNTPTQIEMISNEEKLLPPAGDFPERRASEQCNPQILQQKDLRLSNVLNRRRRNLSQTSLEPDKGPIDPINVPVKMVKTLSFEKNLAQMELEHLSPYVGSSIKMTKGVSFEFDQNFTNDPNGEQFIMNIHRQTYLDGEPHRILRR